MKAKFFDPNFNAQTQVSQIQDAITSGDYQAFVVQANDGNAVIPAIQQAIKEDIAVVAEFTPIGSNYASIEPPIPGVTFVGESPVHNGTELGALGIQACKGLNPCNVAYLEGFKSLPLDNARTAAVKKQLATASNVKLVADVEGGYTQASGLKAAQDVLQAHSDVNVIIGSSQAIEGAAAGGEEGGQDRADQADRQRRLVPGRRRREVRRVVRDVRAAGDDVRPQGDAARDQGRQRPEGADELQRRHAHEPAADEAGPGEDALQGAVLRLRRGRGSDDHGARGDHGARMTTGPSRGEDEGARGEARPLVEARGVSKRFGGVQALDGVSIVVRAGHVHGLVGENGAGKSTLAKVIGGVHRPDEGELLVDGPAGLVPLRRATRSTRASRRSRRRSRSCRARTVVENVMLGIEPNTGGHRPRRARCGAASTS